MVERFNEAAFQALRQQGATLPNNPMAARAAATSRVQSAQQDSPGRVMASMERQKLGRYSQRGAFITEDMSPREKSLVQNMNTRRANQNTDFQITHPIYRDPFEYFRQRTWWFQGKSDEEYQKLREWARLMYETDNLVPSLIDIYSRFPLLDMELQHKDDKLVDFYQQLLFDDLNYFEFLFDLSRERWLIGEAFPLASWHDGIGAWEADELINPDDVKVYSNSLVREHEFYIAPPQNLREIVNDPNGSSEEFNMLQKMYPDLVHQIRNNEEIPVSSMLMRHVKFSTTPWDNRGTPLLLRAFRHLMLKENLMAAQEAVADRFYAPLILANLGLDNVDQQGPWIPEPEDLTALRDDLQVAMNSDYRMIVHHHGLNIQTVFGGERMPQFERDFERIDNAIMQVFGIGRELLSGGARAQQPYATVALNRELITQMLKTHQWYIKRFVYDRIRPVAERQGHYEYEKKGDRRIPIMEKVLMQDPETGDEYVEERPKLAIPELKMRAMSLRDESAERDFLQNLDRMGFPLSKQTMAMNLPIEFEEEKERRKHEQIETVIAEQEFKVELFEQLFARNIPVPAEYKDEYAEWLEAKKETGDNHPASEPAEKIEPLSDEDLPVNQMADYEEGGGEGGDTDTDSGEDVDQQRPAESDEERQFQTSKKKASKESVLDDDIWNEVVANLPSHLSHKHEEYEAPDPTESRKFAGKKRLSIPYDLRLIRKKSLPEGIKITSEEEFDAFFEDETTDDDEEV